MNKDTAKKYIKRIDTMLGRALEPLPVLPKKAVTWLSDYLWILTAVGAVIVVLSIIMSLSAISSYVSFMDNTSALQGIYMHPVYGSLWMLSTVVSVGFSLLIAYLSFKAVTPLREKKAYGWNLLLVTFIVSGIETIVYAVLLLNVFNFIATIIISGIFYAIGAYFLYQVKPHFVKAHKK